MDSLTHAWALLVAVFNSGVLWKVVLFTVIFFVLRGAYKIQHSRENDVDFFDLIRDFSLPGHPISLVKTFYTVGATITTMIYAIACTRSNATITDINIFTITYGALWTGSQIGNKLAERPGQPSVTINNPPNQ